MVHPLGAAHLLSPSVSKGTKAFSCRLSTTENPETQAAHKPPLSSGEMLPLSAGLMALTYIPHSSQPPEWLGDLESEFDVSIPGLHWL